MSKQKDNNSIIIDQLIKIITTIITDIKYQHITESQDEVDKKNIFLGGIKYSNETSKEMSPRIHPSIKIDNRCLSCYNDPSVIIT